MKKILYTILAIIVTTSLVVWQLSREVQAAWYNASWSYRVKIEINPDKVDADLTNYPVYVNLDNLPADFHNHVKSDGSDIRVTKSDEVTEIAREVVFYDAATDTGELHFLADSLSGSATSTFYIYYGNPSASEPAVDSTYGAENVWSDYKAVYHLQQDPSGNGVDAIKDSTANENHLTPAGAPINGTGKLAGKGVTFDGSNDQLVDSNQVWSNADNVATVQMWSNFASADTAQQATIFRYTTSGTERHSAHAPWNSVIYYDFGTCCGSPGRISGSYTAYDDKYSLLHFVTGASLHAIYIDGVSRYSVNSADNPNVDLTGFYLGSGGNSEYHKGTLDECRIRVSALSSAWISTEYNNQNSPSTFYYIASEEEQQVEPAGETSVPLQINNGAIRINNGKLIIN